MFLDHILYLNGYFLCEFLYLTVLNPDMLIEYVSEFLFLYFKIVFQLLVLVSFDEEFEFILIDDCGFLFFHFDDVMVEFFCLEL